MEHEANGGHPTGGQAKWGQIKIQDDQLSEVTYTMTKFCSDPEGALSGADKSAKMSTASTEARVLNSICQGERWERVDCKLQQRRGAYLVSLQ
jgi:hypothetical protein